MQQKDNHHAQTHCASNRHDRGLQSERTLTRHATPCSPYVSLTIKTQIMKCAKTKNASCVKFFEYPRPAVVDQVTVKFRELKTEHFPSMNSLP